MKTIKFLFLALTVMFTLPSCTVVIKTDDGGGPIGPPRMSAYQRSLQGGYGPAPRYITTPPPGYYTGGYNRRGPSPEQVARARARYGSGSVNTYVP